MNTRSKKSAAWALVLVAFGVLALYSGPRGLAILVPAAILVWIAVREPGREIDSRRDNSKVRSHARTSLLAESRTR